METNYRQLLYQAFEIMAEVIAPKVERSLRDAYGESAWIDHVQSRDRNLPIRWEPQVVLNTLKSEWNDVFQYQFPKSVRSPIFEIASARNVVMHYDTMDIDEAERYFQTIEFVVKRIEPEAITKLRALLPDSPPLPSLTGRASIPITEATQLAPPIPQGSSPSEGPDAVRREAVEPDVAYTFSRLCFLAKHIDPLPDSGVFRMTTPHGVFQMTKAEFRDTFPNVIASRSYREKGIYHSPKPPKKAEPFRLVSG